MYFSSAGAYAINYNTDMLQKNFNADMTNPNVYHSIDENFEDHVYAEIKHKDGYIGKIFAHSFFQEKN